MIDNNEGNAEEQSAVRPSVTKANSSSGGLAERRTFLGWLLGLGTVGVAGALSIPLIRFALHPITGTTTETDWADLGPVEDFTEVDVPLRRTITINQLDGWRRVISEKSIYIVRESADKLVVLSAICPHLGCSVRWNDPTKKFNCPCHNGSFTGEGKLVSGPPPRDLDELESRVAEGHLQVRYQSFRQLVPNKEVLA